MPDLHDFDDFDQGLPAMDLPPAAEIRKRGDRMRRRRTAIIAAGGALAVALAIGAPVVATSGGGEDHSIEPIGTPTPSITPDSPPTEWVTEVPADFPLAAGFPTPYETPPRPAGSELTPTCGTWFSGAFADSDVLTYTGESEDRAQRWLILFADEDAARASLDQARASVAACPTDGVSGPPGSGIAQVYDEVDVDLGTDDSFAWSQQVQHDDGLVSDLTLVQVARTGNALLVESHYGAPGGEAVVADLSALLLERASAPLQSMCLFSANPCVIESEAAAPETITGSDDIPDGFALDRGLATDEDTQVIGPDVNVEGVSFADLCETQAWPGGGSTDRLAVRLTGIEYAVTRELVTYEGVDEAAAALAALGDAVAGCPVGPGTDDDPANDRLFRVLDADTGHESSLTFGFTYREGVGGTLFQVVRVGRAVLATSASGDFRPGSLDSGVPGLTSDNRQVTELLCRYTAAGC